MVYPIVMRNEKDVLRVNEIACRQPFDLYISTVNGSYSYADAKSLLGLFNYIGREVYLVGPDDIDPKYFSKLIKRMKLS